MLRLGLGLILLFFTGPLLAGDKTFHLGLLTSIPEANGAVMSLNLNRFLAIQGTYSWALPVNVEVGVPSKKLVSQEDFAIRSPFLTLPFTVDFGPQWSLGALVYPFGGSFYVGLASAHRRVRIRSHVESPLIFEDSDSEMPSNTSFAVDLRTETRQDLLRASVGQRFTFGPLFLGWYGGATQPLHGQSRIETHVNVKNSQASDRTIGAADNLEEARISQENLVREKVRNLLQDFEKQALPLVGLEIGLAF
ncbi:hypothetical protein [Oligoflexus tunisiensis]|uniref:hypothetical protein n=1 Tax=Oligoflexus tunisiensis TaxID=708132 RepID=UPI00114D1648|nr:hypothetical protein [Oligoflexus tunisiensis]